MTSRLAVRTNSTSDDELFVPPMPRMLLVFLKVRESKASVLLVYGGLLNEATYISTRFYERCSAYPTHASLANGEQKGRPSNFLFPYRLLMK